MNIDAIASSMQAQSVGTQVTSNNIVNSQTNEFQPSRAMYEEAPNYGGARVQDIQRTSAQGGPVSVISPEEVNGVMQQAQAMVQSSGTDMAHEMVSLMQTQRAFEANAVALQSQNQMMGYLIDEMV